MEMENGLAGCFSVVLDEIHTVCLKAFLHPDRHLLSNRDVSFYTFKKGRLVFEGNAPREAGTSPVLLNTAKEIFFRNDNLLSYDDNHSSILLAANIDRNGNLFAGGNLLRVSCRAGSEIKSLALGGEVCYNTGYDYKREKE